MKKPNIILISIDTLRADHLSCYGHNKPTTPNIDELAADGTIYRNNYSTGVWTPPGHASMLTGLYVSEHGVYNERRLAEDIPTLATVLKEDGYQTAGFVNNSQVGELVGFNKGHDVFEEVWKGLQYKSLFDKLLRGGARKFKEKFCYVDMGASQTNNYLRNWLKGVDEERPFYAFLHYIEAHNPLNPPPALRNKFLDKSYESIDMEKVEKVAYNPLICFVEDFDLNSEEISYLKDLYDGEIAYVDTKIGEIAGFLKDNNIYDNTMIIITSDHGEHFGEYGLWSHAASLHKEVLNVPLIIKYPMGIERIEQVDAYTQLVDIFPTVMEVAGISQEEVRDVSGVSLVYEEGKMYHEYIFAEWEGRIPYFILEKAKNAGEDVDLELLKVQMSMIQGRKYKYIMKSNEEEELYDISKGYEDKQDINMNKEISDKLRVKLLDRITKKADSKEDTDYAINEEIAENLKSLGYM